MRELEGQLREAGGAACSTALIMVKTVALAFTGASGMPYGVRLLQCLLAADVRVYLLYSQAAQIVARQEMELALAGARARRRGILCRTLRVEARAAAGIRA